MSTNQGYDDNGEPIKKPFKVKIFGFTFGKKHFIVLGVIILVITIASISSERKKQREIDERLAAAQEREKQAQANQGTEEHLDFHEQIQKSLSEEYGEAPEGFEWDYSGNLVSLGDDKNSTSEDVVYMFTRALSILDFSTAEKYSQDSNIINNYKDYYSEISDSINDYYADFLRKQFKKSLTSLEVVNVTDNAVFPDGTQYTTLTVNVLDLTDKDFWRKDIDKLHKTLRVFKETEEDDVKVNQYVYDYIYSKYEDGTIGKREATIELVVSKKNGGGWLVSGDNELCSVLEYESGVDVAKYILNDFESWYNDTKLKEQLGKTSPSGKTRR